MYVKFIAGEGGVIKGCNRFKHDIVWRADTCLPVDGQTRRMSMILLIEDWAAGACSWTRIQDASEIVAEQRGIRDWLNQEFKERDD